MAEWPDQGEWPERLHVALDGETPDLVLQAGRAYEARSAWLGVGVGSVLTLMGGFFLAIIWGSLWRHGETRIEINHRPIVATWDNLAPTIFPTVVAGVLLVLGGTVVAYGVAAFFRRGGWFAVTPSRLLHVSHGGSRSLLWSELRGDVRRTGNEAFGTLRLERRRPAEERGAGSADLVAIVHVPRPREVERILLRRLGEHPLREQRDAERNRG